MSLPISCCIQSARNGSRHCTEPCQTQPQGPIVICNCNSGLPVTSCPSLPATSHFSIPTVGTTCPPPPADTNEGVLFFSERNGAQFCGCMFCGMLGHHVHGCLAAEEHYRTNRLKIIDGWLHLPTGEPIPNDGCGPGLKVSLDAWLAANTQAPMSTPQHDPPPHMTRYSFEISPVE